MTILESREDGLVTVLQMQHGKVQAMDLEFCTAVADRLEELGKHDGGAVVLTGTGRVFSAGVDLKRLVSESPEYVDFFFPALRRLFASAWSFSGPLVVAVNGPAVAGGCVLASAGDWRVLAAGAVIGMPESRLGLPLPAEGIEIIRHVVTPGKLPQILGEGRNWQDSAAVAVGLADQIASGDQLLETAVEHARRMAEADPEVVRLGKRQLRHQVSGRIEEHQARFGGEVLALWKSDRVREKVRQYVAERL